jgi:hypothetical protein
MVFFVIELKSRAVHIAGTRVAPDGAWMTQIARNLLDPVDGFLRHATHLIHDRDPLFTQAWTQMLESGACRACRFQRAVRTAIPTPNGLSDPSVQNASITL